MASRLIRARWLVIAIALALMVSMVVPALAQSNAMISNASRVNLRSGPGAGYTIVTILSAGQQLTLLSSNADGSWYQVQTTGGLIGWVSSRYISANVPNIPLPVSQPTGNTSGVVTSSYLNVRGGPGANFPDMGTLSYGQGVD